MSVEKVELGRQLFFDVRLSANETTSCGTCHHPAAAFSDGEALPSGSTGEVVPRNSMGLTNVAYRANLGWSNPALTRLEEQALVPLFAEFPVELGATGNENIMLERLANDTLYQDLFAAAFADDDDPVSFANIVAAIASFERTLLSYDSPFDRWIAGDDTAISESAKRGFALFNSERAECYHCHGGFDFSNSMRTADLPEGVAAFFNTGLYNVDDLGSYPAPNVGLVEFTGDGADRGKFRVPTLRNIAVTAPYLHDGSAATLSEVLDIYIAGGRHTTEGTFAGDGRANPNKDVLVRPLVLTDAEREDLLAFLEALTDEAFLAAPEFSDPSD